MKQETLEEAAENKYPIENTGSMFMPNRHEVSNIFRQEGFIKGAKWQAERMYSEEDLRKSFHVGRLYQGRESDTTFEGWFEQIFKKK
jgi:hypothetical protein